MLTPTTAARKPILLGILGVSALLVIASALLPGPEARRLAAEQKKLARLVPVASPKKEGLYELEYTQAFHTQDRPIPGRLVRLHLYGRLGRPFPSLRSYWYGNPPQGERQTMLHLDFDPKDVAAVDVATALTLKRSLAEVVRAGLGKGMAPRAFLRERAVASACKMKGSPAWAAARTEALRRLRVAGVGDFPAGTIVYEVEGRAYRMPPASSASGSSGAFGSGAGDPTYEIVGALVNPKVLLP